MNFNFFIIIFCYIYPIMQNIIYIFTLSIVDKSGSDDKPKRVSDTSSKGGKTVSEERLRPIGASAEEENSEDSGKSVSKDSKSDSSGERSVQIIIKSEQGSSTDSSEGQEPQFLPPIV